MLRKLLMVLLLPSLLVGVAVLIIIGLRDLDLLITIVSKLIVLTVIIGIPIIILKMIIFPKKSRDGRR